MSDLVAGLQAGIYEGLCSECPVNGRELSDGTVCAKTAQNAVGDLALLYGSVSPDIDFDSAAEEFIPGAEVCVRTNLRIVLESSSSERPLLSPTTTYTKLDIAKAISRHTRAI